jgi:hypothetical protein
MHRGQVAPQREPRGKDPMAEAAGTGPEVLVVKARLVVHERHAVLELFAAEVAGRYYGRLALGGGRMAGDGVPPERVDIAELVPADVADTVGHTLMHLNIKKLLTTKDVAEPCYFYARLAQSKNCRSSGSTLTLYGTRYRTGTLKAKIFEQN